MVLLPEFLPVLLEYLEDKDEEIVVMTKECIYQVVKDKTVKIR